MVRTASLLFEAPFPVATLDCNLHFTGFSKVWLQTFGLDDNIKGKSFQKILNQLPEELYLDLKLCTQGIGSNSEPAKFVHPNGKFEWYQWKLNPWQASDDQPTGSIIILEKVTEQKVAKDLSQKSQRMARVGGWEVDLLDNTVTWSTITREIHEVPDDFIPNLETGINFYKQGFSRDRITELVTEAIEKGIPWDTELQLVTAKGNDLWVRAKGEAEMVNGKCVRLSGTFQDIDARKRAEIESRKLSDRLEIATGAAGIGVWDFDVKNNILEWDDNMYSLYGVPKNKFNGVYEAWEATVHPEDKPWSAQAVTDAIEGKKDLNMDFRINYNASEIRWIHAEATVIKDEQGNPEKLIGVNWDVTGQKQTESQMQDLLNTTTYQNESLLNFAHIVSHNLRSHATNLSMLTDFLLNDRIGEHEKLNTLQMLKKAAGGLNETIAHLNEVVQFKTEAEKEMTALDVNLMVRKVVGDLQALLEANNVSLKLNLPSNCQVMGVAAYLESAFLNLITNAVKYRDPDKDSKLEITAEEFPDRLTLRFIDNGLGIDLDKHGAKLFGMYKTFHQHPESRGIGLFITRNQIESMGGNISVESTPGEGSCFCISLKTTGS